MSIHLYDFHSPVLARRVFYHLVTPAEQSPDPLPTVWLLHGRGDDHTAYVNRTPIADLARQRGIAVVMPDAGDSWYTNPVGGGERYQEHLIGELIPHVEQRFSVGGTRDRRSIAGLSMGGYGAFKLSMQHPEMFCAAVSLSGAMRVGEVLRRYANDPIVYTDRVRLFGPEPDRGPQDLFPIAEALFSSSGTLKPQLFFHCGTEDFLLECNRLFRDHLVAKSIPHVYTEYPGAHDWRYWGTHLAESLDYLCSAMK